MVFIYAVFVLSNQLIINLTTTGTDYILCSGRAAKQIGFVCWRTQHPNLFPRPLHLHATLLVDVTIVTISTMSISQAKNSTNLLKPNSFTPSTFRPKKRFSNIDWGAILVDWLVEVHMKYRLRSETLFGPQRSAPFCLMCMVGSWRYAEKKCP